MEPRVTTLEALRQEGDRAAFPHRYLQGLNTALVLFAAAFKGKQDACWIAEAGLTATCVDIDHVTLAEMKPLYPDGWEFFIGDAYAFNPGRVWDVVTVDCPSGQFDRAAEAVAKWTALASHVVMLGTGNETNVDPPDGWAVTDTVYRSSYAGGVYWTVLEPV